MGTPEFALPSLEALAAATTLTGVVSQPDKPRGRGLASTPSPIAAAALARDIPLIRPVKLRDPDVLPTLTEWRPDVLVVAAYGKILPRAILELPTLAPLNVHASLLPRHRGAAPIAAAILAGDVVTGITIMLMSEGLDEGDVLLQRSLPIAPADTTASLTARLAALGGAALGEALTLLRGHGLVATPQDATLATRAPRLERAAGRIDWNEPAAAIARKVRAFTPWPSAYTALAGRTVKILDARAAAVDVPAAAAPGTILEVGACIRVASGGGILEVLALQMEGKRALPAPAFTAGARLTTGTRFG
jgi:methionyl-tRNA formyltransferase